jgi:hypothetical protein
MSTGYDALELAAIHQRLTIVECELAQLKERSRLSTEKPLPWYMKHAGKFSNDPEFEEMIRLGQQIRQADLGY